MKKMAVALDVAVCFILNIIDLLIFDFLLHRTARIVVPLFSFGVVEVEAIYADINGFNWLGFKRLPCGRLLLNSTMSMLAGAVFWLLCLLAYLSVTRT